MSEFKSLSIESLKELGLNCNLIKEDLYKTLRDKEVYKDLGLKFGIIYNYDSIQFGKIEELEFNIDNIIEARFFNESKEVVLRVNGEELSGNIVFIKDFSNVINDKACVYGNKNGFDSNKKYSILKTQKIIKYDEDNAAYIAYVKPCSFVEGGR
ncbi:hypothetical protein QYB69_001486 [Clostridium perfringens]|nr:hypothetical protein [Clostridium perfringens]